MNLKDRKLLMMGGSSYYNHIRQYAEKQGFMIIAVGNNPEASYFSGADRSYLYSTTDVENVIGVVRQEKIDGIFVGAQEANILPAINVAAKTGVHFYATREQWDILSDKARFKQICRECGIAVIPDYQVHDEQDLKKIHFPVLIKPVDGSGGKGMNVCKRKEDFQYLYAQAMEYSSKKQAIVEKLIVGAKEVFFQYTIQDGECSLTSAFTKVFSNTGKKGQILPLFHMYPSMYIDKYYEKLHDKMLCLFRNMRLNNGVITVQSFFQDDEFYVFEAGYRMGGAQNYVFSEYQNGTNSLHYMVNFALTGKMSEDRISMADNAYFHKPCCNYYVGLLPGVISFITEPDELIRLPGVLNITKMRNCGDIIEDTNSLDRVCLRLHMVGNNEDELANNLVNVCSAIKVLSEDGNDMVMERLTKDQCLTAIKQSINVRSIS